MRKYGLTLVLGVGLAASVTLAQATGDGVPKKLQAEVSSSHAAETKTAKPKSTSEASSKAKPAASPASSSATETKAIAPPLGSSPVAEPKPQSERLPFKVNEPGEAAPEPPSVAGLLLRTFGALLFLLGLIAAAGWALRHYGIVNFGKQQSETAGLKVLDTVPLGERRTLTLVKFGERTLLIGSTPQGLSLLAEQQDDIEEQGNFRPTVRTVTDLLDVGPVPQFEDEMARASLVDSAWHDRRIQ